MKRLTTNLIFAATLCCANLQAEDSILTATDLQNAYTLVTPTYVSIHDPSIFLDTISSANVYYILGSHLGFGKIPCNKSTGTLNVPQAITTVNETSRTFFNTTAGSYVTCAKAYATQAVTKVKNYLGEEVDFPNFDAHGWQYTGTTVEGNQWAPDVIYNPTMKKWLMYMSLNGDKWSSSIVCMAADKPTGPYIYQGPVVCSGFQGTNTHVSYASTDDWKNTDLAIATGCTTLPERYKVSGSWGTYWPNCIDPCVFYDEEGKLWMSYGSWSGGIWLIELDENTGLRDYTVRYPYQVNRATVAEGAANGSCTCDPYFGHKIAGGFYVSGEGSYIEHFGNYYYLFISYGGFAPDGGYEMRTFRSQTPEGPYKDANGTDAVASKYFLNYGPSATAWPGLKLMGSYQWALSPIAEVAQGHNSATTDKFGRSFVVYHTKFNDGTLGHQVRMHQLFLNQDGWLCAAPFEYNNEMVTQQMIDTTETIKNEEIPGSYEVVLHNYKLNYANLAYQKPVTIQLAASQEYPERGTVTGGKNGTWKRIAGTDYIEMVLSSVTYKGLLVRQTVTRSNIKAIGFTCTSSNNGTIGLTRQQQVWGYKADTKAAIKYTLDHLSVPITNNQEVKENLTLPTTSYLGATIKWTSSDQTILTNTGVVRGDGTVTMTLNISKDGCVYKKEYTLLVGDYNSICALRNDEQTSDCVVDLLGRSIQQPKAGFYVKGKQKILLK